MSRIFEGTRVLTGTDLTGDHSQSVLFAGAAVVTLILVFAPR
jgi:hypothetical protein